MKFSGQVSDGFAIYKGFVPMAIKVGIINAATYIGAFAGCAFVTKVLFF